VPETQLQPVFVVALGASTPIGRDAWSSAAAVRAGVNTFTEHPYMTDAVGEPIRLAMAPWLEADCEGLDRFEALLVPALEQASAPIADLAGPKMRAALAVGLPSARPGLPSGLEEGLRTRIARKLPDRFAAVAVLPAGHAAGIVGLRAAWPRVASGEFDVCVLAGVDSYVEPQTLEWLESNDQLHGAGPLNNAWGFIPGEAAGAVLLCRGGMLERLGLPPLALVLGVGTANEPNRIKTETVCIGEGLTAAFRQCLAGLPPGAVVTDVFCDMNGETYRADEYGFACVRTKEFFESVSEFTAPADCWGDVSAASAPLAIALSAVAARKAYANGRYAFLWGSSETGERGAALLELPPPAGA
jgi:3-oxoacyl-[acyl-carrier-protein] synthase I